MGDPIVDKHILDIIARNPSSDVEVSRVKVKGKEEKGVKNISSKEPEREVIVIEKTKTVPKKTVKKSTSKKRVKKAKPFVNQHVKELKKKVTIMHTEQKKEISALKKEFKKGHEQMKEHLHEVHKTVEAGKNIYVPEPRPSLENQILIESMNKLTAVVKQLVVLFNQNMAKETGPLFSKLNDIAEQNEKIAQGILTVADMLQESKTEPAQIREINPYKPRFGSQQERVHPQRPAPAQMQHVMPPPDLGMYQEAAQQQGTDAGQQPFMGPVPQHNAPLPPFSQPAQEKKPIGPKRMLF